jgi:hypothetical protein
VISGKKIKLHGDLTVLNTDFFTPTLGRDWMKYLFSNWREYFTGMSDAEEKVNSIGIINFSGSSYTSTSGTKGQVVEKSAAGSEETHYLAAIEKKFPCNSTLRTIFVRFFTRLTQYVRMYVHLF